jgi:hypothetical protein
MRRILIVSVVLLPLMGCGSKRDQGGVIEGKITYNNQPVNNAVLHFYPADGKSAEIPVPSGPDGSFNTTSVPPGEYKIVVEPSQGPPKGYEHQLPKDQAKAAEMKEKLSQMGGGTPAATIAFPDKYKTLAKTDLTCTIKQGKQKLPLELK